MYLQGSSGPAAGSSEARPVCTCVKASRRDGSLGTHVELCGISYQVCSSLRPQLSRLLITLDFFIKLDTVLNFLIYNFYETELLVNG